MSWDEQRKIPEKSVAIEVPDPEKYRKKKEKKTKKKADHRHEFVPVLIKSNSHSSFDKVHGFTSCIGYDPGSVCKVCGKLKLGFPEDSQEYFNYHKDFFFIPSDKLLKDFGYLDIYSVDNIFEL